MKPLPLSPDTPPAIAGECMKLCECGCGNPSPLAKRTRTDLGHIRGRPLRFITGHNSRTEAIRTRVSRWMQDQSQPESERFWSKVDKSGVCWVWTGAKDKKGYGRISVLRNGFWGSSLVSRLSWEMHFGEIPVGLSVLHRCDNPPCVRPDHLFLGTGKDNTDDMIRKGRMKRGSQRSQAKLDETDVAQIREMYSTGNFSQEELSHLFDVSRATVGDAIHGVRSWRHV